MSQQPAAAVRISDPAVLIASIPSLIGFTPRQSLVLVGLRPSADGRRVGAVARTDLPARRHVAGQDDPVADLDAAELARALARQISAGGADAVTLITVDDRADAAGGVDPAAGSVDTAFGAASDRVMDLPERGLPDADLVGAVRLALRAVGVATELALWTPRIVEGARWCCYDGCCGGTVVDPRATETAAHAAISGRVTYPDREDAVAALTPDPAAGTPRRRALVDASHRDARAARDQDRHRAAREDLDALRRAAGVVARGEPLDDAMVARALAALCDPMVRDVCVGFVLGADAAVDPACAEPLWSALTRAAPAPERAEPATLLAFAVVEHGGGATLQIALDQARAADPAHRLSGLLAAVLRQGLDPAGLRGLVGDIVDDAATRLRG